MESDLNSLITERRNPFTMDIDILQTEEMVRLINNQDKIVAYAVKKQISNISKAIDLISRKLIEGGRLIYIGASTSGRLGILDASEYLPNFGASSELVQGLISGGEKVVSNVVEGVKDNLRAGENDLKERNFNNRDILIGIATSGRSPYVLGALEYAKSIGGNTIGITNNKNSQMSKIVDIWISVEVGEEVITRSTRMKTGTAQKVILNILSTGTMIKLGKIYENLAIDVQATNQKLIERCKRILMEATGIDEIGATESLEKTDYDVKLSLFMIKTGFDKEESQKILRANRGCVRNAINSIKNKGSCSI